MRPQQASVLDSPMLRLKPVPGSASFVLMPHTDVLACVCKPYKGDLIRIYWDSV